MPFKQSPPELGNQYVDDRALCSHLSRALPADLFTEIEPELFEMGELAGVCAVCNRPTAAATLCSCAGTHGASALTG